jgi:peptide/nickel transport system permease protein
MNKPSIFTLTKLTKHQESQVALFWATFQKHRSALYALTILAVISLLALSAPLVSPYNPTQQEPSNRFALPSYQHWLGTDELGRDVFTRLMYGTRVSLIVGITSAIIAFILGATIGAVAGYYGGWLDSVLMRLTDFFLTLPIMLILILLSAVIRDLPFIMEYRNSVWLVIIVLGIFSWMWPARIVRGSFLSLREREFVTASRSLGASDFHLIFARILPNSLGPLMVNVTLEMAYAITTESGLSFLGFGIQPPTPSLGNLLENAQNHIYIAGQLVIFPIIMIFIIVSAINLICDGLHNTFEPNTAS